MRASPPDHGPLPFTQRTGWLIRSVAVLMCVALAPVVIGSLPQEDRRAAYASVPTRAGPFAYHYAQMVEETTPVDLLIVGQSTLWNALDTPMIQDALTVAWERPAVARTLGFSWEGPDLIHVLTKDMVSRREVRAVLIQAPKRWQTRNAPHPYTNRLVRPNEEHDYGFDALPLELRATWCSARALATPIHLLNRVRTPADRWVEEDPLRDFTLDLPRELGSSAREIGFLGAPFIEGRPPPPTAPVERWIHTECSDEGTLSDYARHFYGLLGRTCADRGIPIIVLDIPDYGESDRVAPSFVADWPQLLGGEVHLVGLPGAELFAGIGPEERERIFFDYHFNRNGSEWFTEALIPALLEILDADGDDR